MQPLLRSLALLLLFTGAQPARAQTYFNNRYPVASTYSGAATMLANGNGFIVSGSASRTPGQIAGELMLAFIDSAGAVQHTRFFQHRVGYNLYSGAEGALMRTHDGGLALVGYGEDATGTLRGVLWRFTPQGDTLWTRTYATSDYLVTGSGCELPDHGFLLAGLCRLDTAVYNVDQIVIRTDSLGRELWRRTYDLQLFEAISSAIPTPDGGYLVTGDVELRRGTWPTDYEALIVKLDSVGNVQWQQLLGGRWGDSAGPALVTPDGGYLVGGDRGDRVVATANTGGRASLTKLSATGVVEWEQRYGPSEVGTGTFALRALADGGYVMAGQVGTPALAGGGAGAVDGFVLKVCADGDLVWYRTYEIVTGPYSQNYLRDVLPTPDGGLAGAGYFHPFTPDTGTQDVWLFRADANGYLLPGGAPPTVTCALSLPEATATANVEVWPNPAADGRFTVGGAGGGATLLVRDALGRHVWAGAAAGAETRVDLSRCAPGLYLLRVTGPDGRSVIRKLLR